MKFKKYENFKHLIYSIILSIILSFIFLIMGINVMASYLLSDGISIIFFIILSIIYKNKVLQKQMVRGVIKECNYSYSSYCDLIYEFDYKAKQENIYYHFSGVEPVGEEENLYILNDKEIIREKDITLFKKNGLIIFSLLALLFIFMGILLLILPMDDINALVENFVKILLLKFMNIFLIFFIITLHIIYNKLKINGFTVKGKIIGYKNHFNSRIDENGVEITVPMFTSIFEYNWHGEKREYISTTSRSCSPKIGTTRKLTVDKGGIVRKEQGDIGTLILFALLTLAFYLIGIIGIFF